MLKCDGKNITKTAQQFYAPDGENFGGADAASSLAPLVMNGVGEIKKYVQELFAMKLIKARIRMYRSIRDTGEFEIENGKTILVGPNEAGKTVILQALQQLNKPEEIGGFEALRDYPRSEYDDIKRGVIEPAKVTVVEGHFKPDKSDLIELPDDYKDCIYVLGRNLDNSAWHRLDGVPNIPTYGSLSKDLTRLIAHVDARKQSERPTPSATLTEVTAGWDSSTPINYERAKKLKSWLEAT